jgi:N6-adenosine-specific RNA methylase IME4
METVGTHSTQTRMSTNSGPQSLGVGQAPVPVRGANQEPSGSDPAPVESGGKLASGSTPYSTIVADPPWPILGKGDGASRVRPPYPLMQVEQIKLMGVSEVAADDAHLWLWTTTQFICQARSVAEAWGFVPSTLITWCKPGLGAGARFRPNTEFIWFCERGYERLPITRRDLGTWFQWPRGGHSVKPEAFYDLVETVSPGPYLELFARRQRMGWHTWGNEAFNHIQIEGVVA